MSRLLAEFIETTKRKISLVFEGFCYQKRRANKDNSVVWQYIHEKNKGCKGKVVSLNDQVTSVTPVSYTHLDVYKRQEYRIIMPQNCRILAELQSTSVCVK